MESRSVTVKDVARRASVSVGTVSRVFHHYANVGEEIRERVLQAAEELGYKKSVDGNAGGEISPLSHRQLKEIVFIYSTIIDDRSSFTSNPFWSHILLGAQREAQKSNIRVTYTTIADFLQTSSDFVSPRQEMKLDGILLVGPAERETITTLQRTQVPLVLVDNYLPGSSVDSVLCNNFEGARLATNYLIEQGHSQIAFIGGPLLAAPRPINKIYTLERRSAGYRTALLDAGLAVDYRLYETTQLYAASGAEACQRLLQRNIPFTAIFCANDEIAIGVMRALRDAGKRVPEDISVIGFDDIILVEHLTPALTTVRVPKEALGSLAVKCLQMRAVDRQMPPTSSLLEVELIVRETVRPPSSRG